MFFSKTDIQSFFRNKKVVFVGDSVYRCMYKDFVLVLQTTGLLQDFDLKRKGEQSFANDHLKYRTELNNGPSFHEIREYQSDDNYHLVQYYFVTRCYNDQVKAMLEDFKKEIPDIVIMNSCQWDVSRYGQNAKEEYVRNMNTLLTELQKILKKETVFLWCTALPLASQIVGGFLLDEVKFLSASLRVFIMEANYEAAQLVAAHGFNVLDLHYYMRASLKNREADGVHWSAVAHRHITDLIITFLYDAYGIPLPANTVKLMQDAERKGVFDFKLPHLSINGRPNFVDAKLAELEKIADKYSKRK